MKFICRNIDCTDLDIEDLVGEITMSIDKEGKTKYKEAKCRKCGEDRELLEDEIIPLSKKNVGIHYTNRPKYQRSSKGTNY